MKDKFQLMTLGLVAGIWVSMIFFQAPFRAEVREKLNDTTCSSEDIYVMLEWVAQNQIKQAENINKLIKEVEHEDYPISAECNVGSDGYIDCDTLSQR